MPTQYTLRMQFSTSDDPRAIGDQLVALCAQARVDEIMVFMFAEELNDGHDTLEQIQAWLDHSHAFRDRLWECGVTVSLNPWHEILHTDRNRTLKPGQDWQRMVDPLGNAATAVVCPLDPQWQAYHEETLRMYARERFRVIWIEDDIRYHNHDPLHWGGCFCPLHVAAFNKRMGTSATREEIVANCLAPGQPHPWRAAWMDMWQDTLLERIDTWRRIAESGGARLGLMSSAMEQHAAEGRRWQDWWRALAGDLPPIHRPHFWGYGDVMGRQLPAFLYMLDQNRRVQPEGVETGPEIECFYYGRWHKSFRQLQAHLTSSLVMGSNNLNISLYDFMGNRPDDEPQRAEFLAKYRPTADWLANLFPLTLKTQGIGIPWTEDMGRHVRIEPDAGLDWSRLVCAHTRGWAAWLGAAGYACCAAESDRLNALSGNAVWGLDDDTILRMLSRSVLLDGTAAHILIKRGFGAHIGATGGQYIAQEDTLYSYESAGTADHPSRMSVNLGGYAERMLQIDPMEGVRFISDLRNPRDEVVGRGAFLFENTLGGRVATVPWMAADDPFMTPQRARQMEEILAWLRRDAHTGSVSGGAWLIPQFLTDGETGRAVIWNASPDACTRFRVTYPDNWTLPTQAVLVDADGQRHVCKMDGENVVPPVPMHQWECVILF